MAVFYLTTPIYYVNATPHLGHAYTTIVADAMARYRRLAGDDVWLLTGTDEHGDKNAQAAAKAGISPQAYVDRNTAAFRETWTRLGITHDDFIRTTEPRHQRVVQAVLTQLWEAGEIYFGKYGGQYCFGCERFYTEKEIVDGKCPDHQTPLTYIEEENYFFKMSKYQDWLVGYIESHPDLIRPERYRNEILGFLREPLQDLSISRPRTRLEWGIALPFDERFVTYVWFDALLNYVSALGDIGSPSYEKFWPHVQHLIGKDILKPHGVYWPCMLKAAGIPIYQHLNVHGYWSLGGAKMSKSIGNVVEALTLTDKYGHDAFRYFLMREMPFGLDASFSEEALRGRYDADLANDLGNLVSRATTLMANWPHPGLVEASADDYQLVADAIRTTRRHVHEAMQEFACHRALAEIWTFVRMLNGFIAEKQPWTLQKIASEQKRLESILDVLAHGLWFLGIALDPFLPNAAGRIRTALGHTGVPRLSDAESDQDRVFDNVKRLSGLFPRLSSKEAAVTEARVEPVGPPRITIDEFRRLDLRVAEVVDAEPVPKSKKLLKLTVRLGDDTRTVVAGIAEHYRPEQLRGRKVVVVANLEPATLMGVASNGMVLAGSEGDTLALLILDRDLPPGAKVR
jgi:methionyl-tRNA synthetase